MTAPATYDPALIQVIVGGAIIKGFADGEFVNVEYDNDLWNKVSGADGLVTRAKQNDLTGLITLTLQQSSLSNDVLTGFAIIDKTTNVGIVPVTIKDILGTTLMVSAYGWVRKLPPVTYGKEVTNREWQIDCAELDVFVGSNFQFSV
jgi:hypothetical protein